jgi:hypothetical protein
MIVCAQPALGAVWRPKNDLSASTRQVRASNGTLPSGPCDQAPSTARYDAILLMSCPSLREHEDAPW